MSVRLLTFSFSFSLLVNKQAGFHLIAKSARLSPRILIQLQFGLNGLGQGSKSQIWNQFYSKHSVMPFTLSYLRATGASKTERELLVQTNAFYKQRFSNKTVLHVASSTFFYITFLIYPEAIYGQKWKKSIFQLLPGNQDFARVFLTVALKYSRKCRLFVTNNN